MYCINDRQIDFILDDIRRNGIELEDLQLNLLDHVCCIIEQELEENGDFERFYFTVIRRFYKTRLGEIEEETHSLLTFKHYYFMKKAMMISGTFAAIVLSMGIALKFLHMPGASICVVSGIFMFSCIFLPLMATLKIREKQDLRDRILLVIGCTAAICICFAILFKLQYWPGANALGLITMGILILVYLPVYFITGVRRPETKVNTIVSSVILVAGCGLFLSLARTPQSSYKMKELSTMHYLRSEKLLDTEQELVQKQKADNPQGQVFELGKNINKACDELKAMIIERETGLKQVSALNGVLLSDDRLNLFAANPEAAPLVDSLNKAIETYNRSVNNDGGLNKLPEDVPFLRDRDDHCLTALNDLVLLQLNVLQNQRALAFN